MNHCFRELSFRKKVLFLKEKVIYEYDFLCVPSCKLPFNELCNVIFFLI